MKHGKNQCIKKVFYMYSDRRCLNAAQTGSNYCWTHDPDRRALKRAQQEVEWKEKVRIHKLQQWGPRFYQALKEIDHPIIKEFDA